MKEFQFDTLWAVMQIMLGAFFWPALIVIILTITAFVTY